MMRIDELLERARIPPLPASPLIMGNDLRHIANDSKVRYIRYTRYMR